MTQLSRSYWDERNQITLEIEKQYHQGQSDWVFLSDGEHLIRLWENSQEDCGSFVRHFLSCPDLNFGMDYEVVIRENYRCPLQCRFVVKTDWFEEQFFYDGSDLGSRVQEGRTEFKVWAPTAVQVFVCLEEGLREMQRQPRGVFSYTAMSDLSGQSYRYLVFRHQKGQYCLDPYAKTSLANSKASVVCTEEPLPISELSENSPSPLIYEAGIRDVSTQGTFVAAKAMLEDLKKLGVTHLQLMPVNDFGSVDDLNREVFYNWGYDPMQYQCLENSYFTNPKDPLKGRREFAELVNACHQQGIGVVLDVVFNHHYLDERSAFGILVPYYAFRYENGRLAEGTFCGNELDSQRKMVRKYFIDTLLYYVKNFRIDGFRFDLMSFIDLETMSQIRDTLRAQKANLLLYGEGWNMKTAMDPALRCCMENAAELQGVGFFNDDFRNVMRGSHYDLKEKGYGAGQTELAAKAVFALEGNRFGDPLRCVNYIECHDNMTLWDKLKASCDQEDETTLSRRQILLNGCVLFSKGLRFLHAGQQWGYSKKGIDNSYNLKESINNLTCQSPNLTILQGTECLTELYQRYHLDYKPLTYRQQQGLILAENPELVLVINPSDQPYHYSAQQGKLLFDGLKYVNESFEKEIEIPAVSLAVIEK